MHNFHTKAIQGSKSFLYIIASLGFPHKQFKFKGSYISQCLRTILKAFFFINIQVWLLYPNVQRKLSAAAICSR